MFAKMRSVVTLVLVASATSACAAGGVAKTTTSSQSPVPVQYDTTVIAPAETTMVVKTVRDSILVRAPMHEEARDNRRESADTTRKALLKIFAVDTTASADIRRRMADTLGGRGAFMSRNEFVRDLGRWFQQHRNDHEVFRDVKIDTSYATELLYLPYNEMPKRLHWALIFDPGSVMPFYVGGYESIEILRTKQVNQKSFLEMLVDPKGTAKLDVDMAREIQQRFLRDPLEMIAQPTYIKDNYARTGVYGKNVTTNPIARRDSVRTWGRVQVVQDCYGACDPQLVNLFRICTNFGRPLQANYWLVSRLRDVTTVAVKQPQLKITERKTQTTAERRSFHIPRWVWIPVAVGGAAFAASKIAGGDARKGNVNNPTTTDPITRW
jgi:hypothetical protein